VTPWGENALFMQINT